MGSQCIKQLTTFLAFREIFIVLAGQAGTLSDVSQFKIKDISFFWVISHRALSLKKSSILFFNNLPETYQFSHYPVNKSNRLDFLLLQNKNGDRCSKKLSSFLVWNLKLDY